MFKVAALCVTALVGAMAQPHPLTEAGSTAILSIGRKLRGPMTSTLPEQSVGPLAGRRSLVQSAAAVIDANYDGVDSPAEEGAEEGASALEEAPTVSPDGGGVGTVVADMIATGGSSGGETEDGPTKHVNREKASTNTPEGGEPVGGATPVRVTNNNW